MNGIQISRLHYPVANLGYGQRAGIWMQGCTVRCRGCISRDTWPADPNSRTTVESVLTWIARHRENIDGITISGGEPTDQPEALTRLLHELNSIRNGDPELDILVFTGRSLGDAADAVPILTRSADVVISEPFIRELTDGDLVLRGSSNQVVTALTPLGVARYGNRESDDVYRAQRQSMGIHVNSDSVWLVGIPRPGDLKALESELAKTGVEFGRKSWLS